VIAIRICSLIIRHIDDIQDEYPILYQWTNPRPSQLTSPLRAGQSIAIDIDKAKVNLRLSIDFSHKPVAAPERKKVVAIAQPNLSHKESFALPRSPSTAALNIGRNLKLFFALSRTPHALIDMTAPAEAALLCLGHLPSFSVTVIGIITMFAGYTAVYALNDVVDLKTDKEKVRVGGYEEEENYLDSAMIRHPMAKGALSLSSGLAWTFGWAAVALVGAYWLNPVCLYIFLAGCILESVYCMLWRVTPLRTMVNGVVKTLGAMAAVFAVTPDPSILFLAVLFLWIFFWEIGGQNIPCDWTDIEEDRRFNAKTIPVRLGPRRASVISVSTLVCAMFFQFAIFWVSPLSWNPVLLLGALGINAVLLLWPAFKLAEGQDRRFAMELFNKASYYPLATLILVFIQLIIS